MFESSTPYHELQNSEVKLLQEKLSALGYYPYYYIDGLKGTLTETGIKQFAKDHWLNTDETMVLGNTFVRTLDTEIEKKDTSPTEDFELSS